MYTAYSSKRPDGVLKDDDPFYLVPRTKDGCSSQCLCFLRQRLEEVYLRKMLNTMSVAANFHEGKRYTNQSARKYLVQKPRGHECPPT
ncbi:hypothetical protein DPMN_192074 [Dreissena polymorpha]|uniref:Uncharacterized protein n=1 Tax=Dreissena polymorpha TaxID=45954 RepID=A0A9D3Y196_DREPO|nr:hypothetical protein DPMN_192074 [Dreissena polymorpha]